MSRKFIFGGSFGSAVPLLLDLYPATAAYSVRKLRTAYTGACMRVRRSSDNAEQDIGFVGNNLDTASLLSFVGAGSGFVTAWYNQGLGGLTYDSTQTSAGVQPIIVNAGVLITVNSIVSPQFSTRSLNVDALGSYFSGTIKNISSFIVAKHTTTADAVCVSFGNSSNNNPFYILSRNLVNFRLNIRTDANVQLSVGTTTATTNQYLATCLNRASDKLGTYRHNGTFNASATGSYLTSDPITLNVGSIGSLKRMSQALYTNGQIQEVIIFDTYEDSNATAIETNINAYYGIYP
jgi:hypothetical protein